MVWAGASAVLALVGCAGPWITALFISRAGLDTPDGRLVGLLALIGGVMLVVYGTGVSRSAALPVLTTLAGALCAVTAASDLVEISSEEGVDFFGSRIQVLQPGWGLYLALAASVSLVIASGLLARQR